MGSEPNVGGEITVLGNAISESLPKSARQRSPAGTSQCQELSLERLIKSTGLRSNIVRDYFRRTHMILVQLNTNWSAEMFLPAGPDIKVGQKVNKCFPAMFFLISYMKWSQKASESHRSGISVLPKGGWGGSEGTFDMIKTLSRDELSGHGSFQSALLLKYDTIVFTLFKQQI